MGATFREIRLQKEFSICRAQKIHVYLLKGSEGSSPDPGVWRIFIPIQGFTSRQVLWDLLAVFPPHYPLVPPFFKFISFPNNEMAKWRMPWTEYHPKMRVIRFIRQIQKLKVQNRVEWTAAQLDEAFKNYNPARPLPLPDITCLQLIDQRNPWPIDFQTSSEAARPEGKWTGECSWSQVTGKRFPKSERSPTKPQFVIPKAEDLLLA
jgi:hypothetical protein